MDHILTHGWEDAFQYGLSEGNPELRAAICQIMLDRGIHCGVEDVVVTTGSQQSLDILARALINPRRCSGVRTAYLPGGAAGISAC